MKNYMCPKCLEVFNMRIAEFDSHVKNCNTYNQKDEMDAGEEYMNEGLIECGNSTEAERGFQ